MSYCHNCGNKTSQTSKFCSNCGTTICTTPTEDSDVIKNEFENLKKTSKPIYKRFWFWFWVAFEIFIAVTNSKDKIFIMWLIPWMYFAYNYLFDWIANLFARMNRKIALILIILLITFLVIAKSIV
ncbi:zinc ribbon domain-containing protein [Epilithonimonas caeni]|uniref:zinc ribbon domain-containing protein n=1 Tax=Epilithonimonas caeni TaxID=365343 RepID=UPI0004826092